MDGDLVRHFAERASTYDLAPWVHDPQVMAATLRFVDPQPGQRILDVGAGTGAVAEAVLAACPEVADCVALDISPEMLSHVRNPRIRICCHDACELPFPDSSFDVAICRQTLHYIDDLPRCLGKIRSALRPDGRLVVGQMTPWGSEDEAYWRQIVRLRQPLRRHDLTAPEIASLLQDNGFHILHSEQIPACESLNSWLTRYEDSDRQLEEVRRLHMEAPESYRKVHHFEYRDGDVLLDNCWTFVSARRENRPSEPVSR